MFNEDENEDLNLPHVNMGRESVIFAIQCCSEMFSSDDSSVSYFNQVMESIHDMFLNKIVVSNKDLQGVIFYGTRESKNSSGFKCIYNYLDLSMPSVANITKLKEVKSYSYNQFSKAIGTDKDYSVNEVLWEAFNMFSACTHKLASKHLILLTWESHPHRNNESMVFQAKSKAEDLNGHGIDIQVFSFNPKFDYQPFYREVVSNSEDLDSKKNALDGIVNLYNFLSAKASSSRPYKRLPLKLGGTTISVEYHSIMSEVSKSSHVKIDVNTNKQVFMKKILVDGRDNEVLLPSDIKYSQKWGGDEVAFTREEVDRMKYVGQVVGFVVLGFKPVELAIKRWYNCMPAKFIYPDESSVKGSKTFFKCLLKKCHEKNVVAVCSFALSEHSVPRLVCLLPQMSESSTISSAGFYVITLPYSDDIRQVEISSAEPTQEQVDLSKLIMKKLRFTYDTNCFDNPALQTHYKALEAMALELPSPQPVQDFTIPDYERIARKAGDLLGELHSLIFPPDYNSNQPAKRPAKSASATENKKIRESELTEVEIENYAKTKQLSKLTVAGLKEVCKKLGIRAPSKKQDIISRIEERYNF